jgi:hypothetical protein
MKSICKKNNFTQRAPRSHDATKKKAKVYYAAPLLHRERHEKKIISRNRVSED